MINKKNMRSYFEKLIKCTLVFALVVLLGGCDKDDSDEPNSGGASNAKVEVTGISVGSKDSKGRYTVKISVKAKNIASDESIKTIGAKWGTVKSNPSSRDSRSGISSATFTSAWHTNSTYYVTPFLKTNKTSGEITGQTKTKKTP